MVGDGGATENLARLSAATPAGERASAMLGDAAHKGLVPKSSRRRLSESPPAAAGGSLGIGEGTGEGVPLASPPTPTARRAASRAEGGARSSAWPSHSPWLGRLVSSSVRRFSSFARNSGESKRPGAGSLVLLPLEARRRGVRTLAPGDTPGKFIARRFGSAVKFGGGHFEIGSARGDCFGGVKRLLARHPWA